MSEMIDRVARALHDEWNGVGLWDSKSTNAKDRWRFMARAAIEAMREQFSDENTPESFKPKFMNGTGYGPDD